MQFLFGFVTAIIAAIVAVVAVAWAGLFNVAATQQYATLERVLHVAATRSIARHADTRPNSYPETPQALAAGLQAYAEMCLMCHGAPGVDPSTFARHLSPQPPEITSSEVQGYTDGELFWIIAHGIMATGMPAFSPTHREEDLWEIVTFVRHLPQLSAEERQHLLAAQSGHHQARPGQGHADHTR